MQADRVASVVAAARWCSRVIISSPSAADPEHHLHVVISTTPSTSDARVTRRRLLDCVDHGVILRRGRDRRVDRRRRSTRRPASTSTCGPGSACSSMATFFLVWALTRPLSEELDEAAAEAERRGAGRGREHGADRKSRARRPRLRREQREHRPPEPAAHDAGAQRAGVLAGLDRALDLGHGYLVVVAKAGRARRRAAARASPRSPAAQRRDGLVDALVLGQHVPDAAIERGRQAGGSRSASRRSRRRTARRPAGTRRGARCSPSRPGCARRPSRARRACGSARSSGTGRDSRARMSMRNACRQTAEHEASWSSRPVSTPVYSFSTRGQRWASSAGADCRGRRAARASTSRRIGRPRTTGLPRAGGRRRSSTGRRRPGRRRRAARPRPPARRRASPRGGRVGQGKGVRLRQVGRLDLDSVAVVERRRDDRRTPLPERERKAESVVVIGVLADQIDASRGERLDASEGRRRACSGRESPVAHLRGRILGSIGDRGAAIGSSVPPVRRRSCGEEIEVEVRPSAPTTDPRSGWPLVVPPLVILWVGERPLAVRAALRRGDQPLSDQPAPGQPAGRARGDGGRLRGRAHGRSRPLAAVLAAAAPAPRRAS